MEKQDRTARSMKQPGVPQLDLFHSLLQYTRKAAPANGGD
jgi:hypothetical protein